ncbi:predicted protein [Botrytis cinerea T4]|uniref:Uncharacterized protein n=1 Tax=Botryotinia fuckeliana (strain T4) TaxID=999810 RepID=G2YA46_BOTF4|nr:predicted protein [Botrytis cinerea T4]
MITKPATNIMVNNDLVYPLPQQTTSKRVNEKLQSCSCPRRFLG